MQPRAAVDILLGMLLLVLLEACTTVSEGPHALAFDGSPDCGIIAVSEAPPSSFTVEVWMRSDPEAFGGVMRPLSLWNNVFNLSENVDEQVVFIIGEESVGASSPFSLMDGQLHHVAGSYDGALGSAKLFIDGALVGSSGEAAFVGDSPADQVQFGCAKANTEAFYGVLDELRISSIVRYTDSFELPTGAFEGDDDTLMLFHLDEGTGTTATSTGDFTMEISEAAWVEFELGGEE
ncbi:MAG: LamG domain-containing protein [Myxococcales bacterium]|nr:LamG domain-containing protein [Myxococcales bacterium]